MEKTTASSSFLGFVPLPRPRLHLSLRYRLIAWMTVAVAIPLAALAVVAVQTVEQDSMRQAQEKVVGDLNVAGHILKSKGVRAEIVDGKMVLEGGYTVNNNPEIVDTIASLVGGNATVFQGDTRISTTVKKDDGTRAVGTQAAANVVDLVLKQGQRYVGRAWVVNAWYITAYDPIKDPNGKTIGMLFVGTPEKPFVEAAEAFRNRTLLVGLLGLLLAQVIAFLTARNFGGPVRAMTKAAGALAAGDVQHDAQLDEKRGDELGEMAVCFGQMVGYVREMAAVADAISQGDLTREVRPRSERDALGIAFGSMIANLRETVGGVSASASALAEASQRLAAVSGQAGSATNQIATTIQQVAKGNQDQSSAVQETSASVDQLARAIDQIAKGTQEQTRSIEKTAASVAQLNGSIAQVSTASRELASAGEQVGAAATSGAETVRKSARGMIAIKATTNSAAAKVQELGKFSEQIGSIVEAIDDIAEQTNLLALNAAIEAARAGEHGRGFAVVADEVRKLAERSSRETKQIAELITQVQKGTQEAVEAMSRGAKEVELGTSFAEEAGEALKNILSAVQITNQQVSHIASAVGQMEAASQQVVNLMDSVSAIVEESTAATQEMASSSQQVAGAMEKVAAVSEETSAAAEEVSASTEEMSSQVEEMVTQTQSLAQMAEELKDAVSHFEIGGGSQVVMRRRQDDWGNLPSRSRSQEGNAVQ